MRDQATDQILYQKILPQLQKVKSAGHRSVKACCPAHEDKNPSFQATLADNGNILLKCWAGCSIESICQALGIQLSDLFAEKHSRQPSTNANGISFRDKMRLLSNESRIVLLAAEDLKNGKPLSPDDHARLVKAAARIEQTWRACSGR